MTDMFFSAANGMFSLLSEKTRVGFIDSLEAGIIQEGVLSQATAGPMMMLSLFHDLQNPLFKKHKFDPNQFLQGLAPSLESFHNISAALENELDEINQNNISKKLEVNDENSKKSDHHSTSDEETSELGAVTKEEKESLLSALRIMTENDEFDAKQIQRKNAQAILDHEWLNEARDHPDSLAGQLSRMVTKELFQINQLSSKTAFLLQNRDILFREGSCRVNNVALLSARACLFKEKEGSDSLNNDDSKISATEYEPLDYNLDYDVKESETAVAAQLEVLYDVTQEFVLRKSTSSNPTEMNGVSSSSDSSSKSANSFDNDESTHTTIVSVATIEGWLHGGPDNGELRWKLASYRPPYEFPGIEHAYKY